MRIAISWALLALCALASPSLATTLYVDDLNDGQVGAGTSANPYRDLQTAIDRAAPNDTIFIRSGLYDARVTNFIDPTCGNCIPSEFRQSIPATRGFSITKPLILQGESRKGTILRTGAGYGVFFDNAGTSEIKNLTVTGGARDWDEKATNAAIVARWTTLTVRDANLIGNNDLPEGATVGVGGIVGREGSAITADNLLIKDNSWDGIALYRGDPAVAGSGARAGINNVEISHGRGVGIGCTWDSQADIADARISYYWKGVGAFGNARVTLRNSIIRNNEGWGVTAYGATNLTATNNVVTEQGRFGLGQFTPDATVTFTNNIVYGNGWNPDYNVGPPVGIWLMDRSRAMVAHNNLYANPFGNDCSGPSTPENCLPINLAGTQGNISADPRFTDINAANFTLRCDSPSVNTGVIGLNDRDGSRSDMGAYGGPWSPLMPPACGQPDLQPTSIDYLPASPEAGDSIFFDSGVTNAGPVGIGSFNVKWFVDGVQVGYGGHQGMAANSLVLGGNSFLNWTATQGTHTVMFTVDADGTVVESNEGNNSTSITVNVVAPRADLTPTSITYNSADLVRGRQVLFDSGVTNLKNVPTGTFNIKWYVDNVQVGYGVHNGVPGSTTVMNGNSQYKWTATAGQHVLRFVLDADNGVAESNEGNNSVSVTVNVP